MQTKIKPSKAKSRTKPRHVEVEQINFIPGESKTQQHFREEVDINNIVARFKRTGQLVGASTTEPQFGDISAADFMTLQNHLVKMRTRFMGYPAKVRNMFNNDLGQMLAFAQDPDNKAEAQKLGLIPRDPAPTPQPAPKAETPPKAPEGA